MEWTRSPDMLDPDVVVVADLGGELAPRVPDQVHLDVVNSIGS